MKNCTSCNKLKIKKNFLDLVIFASIDHLFAHKGCSFKTNFVERFDQFSQKNLTTLFNSKMLTDANVKRKLNYMCEWMNLALSCQFCLNIGKEMRMITALYWRFENQKKVTKFFKPLFQSLWFALTSAFNIFKINLILNFNFFYKDLTATLNSNLNSYLI